VLSISSACTSGKYNNAQTQSKETNEQDNIDSSAQIGEYVVEAYEDNKGTLWFGTMNYGVARYDGSSLKYFSASDGLPGNTVTRALEDKYGNMWFATHSGLSKYDGTTFTNYTTQNGLCDDRVANLLFDQSGKLWIGTWGGVCAFDGSTFTKFPLPNPDVQLNAYQNTMDWTTEIIEDRNGNIWFGRDGYGACKYDPISGEFTHLTKKDGLPSNNVQAIVEDNGGNIWIGCRVAERDAPDSNQRSGEGGLARYDGKSVVQFPDINGLNRTDIYTIFKDKDGTIWIGANGVGLYSYDGQKFTLFNGTERPENRQYGSGIQSIIEDRNGVYWLGLSGGLYKLKDSTVVNVLRGGPWE